MRYRDKFGEARCSSKSKMVKSKLQGVSLNDIYTGSW
jgi:hypothetical protein